jgi:hypothetical protein
LHHIGIESAAVHTADQCRVFRAGANVALQKATGQTGQRFIPTLHG